MTPELVYFCSRLALAAVLTIAAIGKLPDLPAFRAGLAKYDLLPPAVLPAAAVLVPVVELLAAVALAADYPRLVGPALATVVFAAFSIALVTNLRRGRAVPCHCFGSSQTEVIDTTATVRTVLLTVLALAVLGLGLQGYSLPPGDAVLPAVATAAVLVLLTRLAGFVPTAWSYLREPRSLCTPGGLRRISLRDQPMDTSIKALFRPPPAGDNGHVTDLRSILHQIGDPA